MYEEEFEEGLKRLDPKIAAMMREANQEAIREDKISGDMMIAGFREVDKKYEEEKKAKQEMMDMLDRAVEESKDYDK